MVKVVSWVDTEHLLFSKRYYALVRAASEAKNPEFKDLWKRKLFQLIENHKIQLIENHKNELP